MRPPLLGPVLLLPKTPRSDPPTPSWSLIGVEQARPPHTHVLGNPWPTDCFQTDAAHGAELAPWKLLPSWPNSMGRLTKSTPLSPASSSTPGPPLDEKPAEPSDQTLIAS